MSEQIDGGVCMRKNFDTSKSGVYALGYIRKDTYLAELCRLVGANITLEDFEKNVSDSYNDEKEINYNYDSNGNLAEGAFDEKKTCRYAIETGYYKRNNNPIYIDEMIFATFIKDSYGSWTGVKFFNKFQMRNNFNAYRFGSISFKDFNDANNFIINLEKELLPGEKWMFKKSSIEDYRKKTKYDILQSYLQHIFEKLLSDFSDHNPRNADKILFSDNKKYVLFNSGLLNKFAQDIYILGEVFNLHDNNRFVLSNPIIAPGKVELIKSYAFNSWKVKKLPDVVEFFDDLNDIMYDSKIPIDLDDTENMRHIIEDGIKRDRFPQKYKDLFNKGDLASISTTLKTAIENSKKIAKRNYKYVVPQYRSGKNGDSGKIQFLMPIYLDSQYGEKPDFALVLNIEKFTEQSYYTPETVLELPWAYNNARVICKPEDTWLNPTTIDSPPLEEDIDHELLE
jgi:hypothetical protein